MKKTNLLGNTALALILCVSSFPASATPFTITNGSTASSQQVLDTGETGTVDNGGTVSVTAADGSAGTFSFGSYATAVEAYYGAVGTVLTNNGTIYSAAGNATSGNYNFGGTAYGIQLDGNSDGGMITNNGSITVIGGSASGGSIQNTAENAFGIGGDGKNGIIINNGTILATGGTATGTSTTQGEGYGIYFDGGAINNNITNNGTITATGPNAYAVRIDASGSTFTNNGTLNATGANNNYAYYDDGSNNTLIIGPNAHFNAPVAFTGTGAIVQYTSGQSFPTEGGGFNMGMSGSTPDFSNFTGTYSVNVIDNGTGVVPPGAVLVTSGGNTYAATPDVFANGDQLVITQSAAQAGNLVVQRQQLALLGKTTDITGGKQYASNAISDVEPAAGGDGAGWGLFEKSVIWAEGFGDYQERPQDGLAAQSRARSGGALTGIDLPENAKGYRTGVYGGGFAGRNELGKTTFRTIDSKGGLVGGYIGHDVGSVYVSAQMAVGYADNDSDRIVGSGDTASASYSSYFISPSVSVMTSYANEDVTWVPSITLRYTGQYADNYNEHGSTANEDVDSRTSQTIGARAQLEAHLHDQQIGSGTLTPTGRIGVDGQKGIGNGKVDLSVLGSSVSLNADGGQDNVDGIIGGNLAYTMDSGTELYADGEASMGLTNGGTNNNLGGTARIGARWKF